MAARPLAALARAVPRSRPAAAGIAARRGILTPTGGHPAQAAAAAPAVTPQGSLGGVDARIFAGVPQFIGEPELARLNEWQAGLWTRLQDEVRNNPRLAPIKLQWDNTKLDMTELLAFSARDPALSLVFNYASLLINNSYFLEGLNPEAAQPVPAHFQALEDRVAAYAEGTIGSGWLWIVKSGDQFSDLDVVPTFAAGTLLVTARAQRGREGALPVFGTPATSGDEPSAAGDATPAPEAASPPPRFGKGAKSAAEMTPLAVLNLFEHAYLGDRYGVFSRGQYARDWFRALDWSRVAKRMGHATSFSR